MLLFTLLTTLFLGSPGAPAKDTLPVVKPRPSIGMFYMMGPRAYGSTGFLGVQGSMPLSSSYQVSLGLGGDFHKQLDRNPTLRINRPPEYGGNTFAYQTMRITRALSAELSFSRRVYEYGRFGMLVGLCTGFTRIYSTYEYDILPGMIANDSSTTRGIWVYSHQNSKYLDLRFWAAPKLVLTYELDDRLSLEAAATLGFCQRTVDENFEYVNYQLGIEYSDKLDRFVHPYDFTGIRRRIIGAGYGVSLDNQLPKKYTNADALGFSSFSLNLHYQL